MAGVAGFEPTNARVNVWVPYRLATPQFPKGGKENGVSVGLEPTTSWPQPGTLTN